MKVNIDFKIPVTLFDFRESENSLYSYAKLKIFYVGETQDKRLFTKKFSDKLLESLPYVPVVGYYDEEEEDFIGHNSEVQYIYGIVPEDTSVEYISEDGKEYAVCDVILYTGRGDKTGEIAQKIIGKPHSLELNPNTTTFKINRTSDGKMKNIEFLNGTLLGLSILGSEETPAFAGAGFFSKGTHYQKLFEILKTEIDRFSELSKQRGEQMELNLPKDELTIEEEVIEETQEASEFKEEVQETPNVETEVVEEVVAEENIEAENFEETTETEKMEISEFLSKFMKVTDDERLQAITEALRKQLGEYTYIVQMSTEEKVLVYFDYEEGDYFRVKFVEGEEIEFGEKESVKIRFLTEDEINKLWNGTNFIQEEGKRLDETISEEISEFEETKEEKENSIAALNNSERAELEAFRRERKEKLIDSFSEDLSSDFLKGIKEKIDELSFEDLENTLSKEFTRISKQNRSEINKPFAYLKENASMTETERIAELINRYANK